MSEHTGPESNMDAMNAAVQAASGSGESQQAALEQLQRLHQAQQHAQQRGGQPAPQGAPAMGQEAPPQPQAMPIDWTTEGVPAAANGVQVLHRPTEFAVLFTDHTPFPGRRSVDGEPGNERAVVVSSLRLSPDAMFQALCTMANSWNRFATTVIDPRMRQPRFKLVDAGELQLEGFKKD